MIIRLKSPLHPPQHQKFPLFPPWEWKTKSTKNKLITSTTKASNEWNPSTRLGIEKRNFAHLISTGHKDFQSKEVTDTK